MQPSIIGAQYRACASFNFSVPTGTGSTGTTLPRGSYYLVATVDTWVKLGASDVVATVPATRSAGGAVPSLNSTFLAPAYQVTPLEIDSDGTYFSVIAASAGTLAVVGPISGR